MTPVDTARIRSAAEALAWRHGRHVEVDLNGDGRNERVSLRSDVSVGSNDKPLWEDGHRWAVVVEDGARQTLLYGAFVPNGHVEMAILEDRSVLVVQRTPQQLQTFVVAYNAAGEAVTISAASHSVSQWMPDVRH